MTDKQINRWLRRRFTAVGWILVAYYLLMNVMTLLTMAVDAASQALRSLASGNTGMDTLDLDAMANNAWGYILTIFIGLVILYAWKGWDYFRTDLLCREKPMNSGVFGILLCLCMGSQMVNSLWIGLLELLLNQIDMSAMEILESVSGDTESVSMFLYASILAPISEEILFRGYALRTLKPFGKRFAIFGSAFLFGLFHGNLLQTPYAFLMGLVLGYVAVEYSLIWAIALHMFNNLVLADLLTRLTAALPEPVMNILTGMLFGGCAIASVVILIVKRREIRAYNRSEWMDRRVMKTFFLNSGVIVLTVLMVFNMVLILFA